MSHRIAEATIPLAFVTQREIVVWMAGWPGIGAWARLADWWPLSLLFEQNVVLTKTHKVTSRPCAPSDGAVPFVVAFGRQSDDDC